MRRTTGSRWAVNLSAFTNATVSILLSRSEDVHLCDPLAADAIIALGALGCTAETSAISRESRRVLSIAALGRDGRELGVVV